MAATAAVPPLVSFDQKLTDLKTSVQTYVQQAAEKADLPKFQAGQSVLLTIFNTEAAKSPAGLAIEATYDILKSMADDLNVAYKLSELAQRVTQFNEQLKPLHPNEVRLTGLLEPLKWDAQAKKVRVVFTGKNSWYYRQERHSLIRGALTTEPIACSDKSWEFEIPVIHFQPKLHEYTFFKAIFRTEWKWTGWVWKITDEYVTETLDLWLPVAPSCPGEIQVTYAEVRNVTETKQFESIAFDLTSENIKQTQKDFVVEVPEGWTLNKDSQPEVHVLRAHLICSYKIISMEDHKFTIHASCGDGETGGSLRFTVKYKVHRIVGVVNDRVEPVDLKYGEKMELVNPKNVTFTGSGVTLSGLEFNGPVTLKKGEGDKYLLSALKV